MKLEKVYWHPKTHLEAELTVHVLKGYARNTFAGTKGSYDYYYVIDGSLCCMNAKPNNRELEDFQGLMARAEAKFIDPFEPWKPEQGGEYFSILSHGSVITEPWIGDSVDTGRLGNGLVFRSKGHAEAAKTLIREFNFEILKKQEVAYEKG